MTLASAARGRKLDQEVKRLQREFGEDALDAFCSAYAHALKRRFVDAFGLQEGRGLPRVLRLVGKDNGTTSDLEPPGCDNPSIFNRGGKPVLFVFQPYYVPQHAALDQFCSTHGLEWTVLPFSWHLPGRTLLIAIWVKGRSPLGSREA